jgi:hypothetical protein
MIFREDALFAMPHGRREGEGRQNIDASRERRLKTPAFPAGFFELRGIGQNVTLVIARFAHVVYPVL